MKWPTAAVLIAMLAACVAVLLFAPSSTFNTLIEAFGFLLVLAFFLILLLKA